MSFTNQDVIDRAIAAVGVDKALAYAIVEKETGGRHVYGNDAGGAWFLFARARSGPPLEQAPSLAELLAHRAADRATRAALLDFEISLGHRDAGAAPRTWRIEVSTLPHREGAALGPAAEG